MTNEHEPHIGNIAGLPVDKFDVSDADGVMRDITNLIITLRTNNLPPMSVLLLPTFTIHGYEYLKQANSPKQIMAELRHHAESRYEAEWTWLRGKRYSYSDALWHAIAFALCVQCMTEVALNMDSMGESQQYDRMNRWLSDKAREHGKHADIDGVTADFLENVKGHMRSGRVMYNRQGQHVEFVTFNE